MRLIDDQGRIFGSINILDGAIFIFVLILCASLLLYVYYPLQLKEHQTVIFQMYFDSEHVPYAVGRQVFVPGNEFIATYEKRDRAVIMDVRQITKETGDIDFLVTVNASLEVDSDGNYLFNGNDVAPGNSFDLQLETSYVNGKIWRVNYTHSLEQRTIFVSLKPNNSSLYAEDAIYDLGGNKIGKVLGRMLIEKQDTNNVEMYFLSVDADIYDGDAFVNEAPLTILNKLSFITNTTVYKANIMGVYNDSFPRIP